MLARKSLVALAAVLSFLVYADPSYSLDLGAIRAKIADLLADPTERKIRELEETRRKLVMERLRLEREVKDFMIDNPIATACLAAMGIQALKFLNSGLQLDETLDRVSAVASVGCIAYTFLNKDEMERVIKQYAKYANRLSEIDSMIAEIDAEIQRLRSQE